MKSREVALVAQEQNNNDEIVIYNTKDIQRILKIGKNNVYELFKLPNFPVIRIGKKYLIPKNEFEEWISNNIYKNIL